jgi:NAD(P)-dependent dehydrogenase (short-subunit alcohol dehydrogenase family)
LLCDISNERSVIETFKEIIEVHERLDVLVNCAGVHVSNFLEYSLTSEFNTIVDTNMRGLFFCIREAIPHLKKTKGVIINVASGVSSAPDSTAPLYSASKAWIKSVTESLYLDYPRTSVRAHVILPGPTNTKFLHDAFHNSPAAIEECGSNIPLGRLIEPQEIAWWIVALIEHGEIVGPVLDLSGGETVNFKTERR